VHLRKVTNGVTIPVTHRQGIMAKPKDPGRPPQERRYRRFSLCYPVAVKVDLGSASSEIQAVSNNLSLGGILVHADSALPQHCHVNFIMTVQDHNIIGPTKIVGQGEVIRVQPHHSGTGFAIAVRCEHPPSAMGGFLPAGANLAGNA
jgi:PilZ domain